MDIKLLLCGLAIASVTAISSSEAAIEERSTPQGTGTRNGFLYPFWADYPSATYDDATSGQYNLQWQNGGNVVAGKGWNPGGLRIINYSCNRGGDSYLFIYGWTRSPLVEYYIVESFGTYNPSSGAAKRAEVTNDGSVYGIYTDTGTDAPSIDGTATFQQYRPPSAAASAPCHHREPLQCLGQGSVLAWGRTTTRLLRGKDTLAVAL